VFSWAELRELPDAFAEFGQPAAAAC
jgi:hypothetical protein